MFFVKALWWLAVVDLVLIIFLVFNGNDDE
jgi:hypothetical protein